MWRCFVLILILSIFPNIKNESIKWKRLTKPDIIQALSSFDLINYINYVANTTWQAGPTNRFKSNSEFRNVLGLRKTPKSLRLPQKYGYSNKIVIPDFFDSRTQWSHCKYINEVRDQSNCGSCWAVAATATITDRYCIHSNGNIQPRISDKDLLSCCGSMCGEGCNGGSDHAAWKYWVNFGIVTGGPYNSHQGCQDYPFPPCSHHVIGPYPNCSGDSPTPQCVEKCQSGYSKSYKDDKYFGQNSYSVSKNVEEIQGEILINGPVEAGFNVFQDFEYYKHGVYQHTYGPLLGGHAVKMIGWGVENQTPYWLIANSWNPTWGDKGYFKIKRGNNECGIEEDIVAGIPKL